MFGVYYGLSLEVERKEKPFDMWCPLMGDGVSKENNYWKEKCDARMKDPNQKGTCYQGCRAKKVISTREKYMKANRSNNGGRAKIPESKREHVIKLLREQIYSHNGIGKIVGVSSSTVSAINKQINNGKGE